MRTPSPFPLLLSVVAIAACHSAERSAEATGNDGGTMVVSVGADADAFFPPTSVNVTAVQINSLVFEHLAEPGKMLNPVGDAGWTGRLAKAWTWARDSMSIAFHLDPIAHWHDGRPVRASDVRFTYRIYTDSTVGSDVAPLITNIDSVTAPDSATAVFWFRKRSPHQFFDAAFQMRILPEHLLAGIKPADLRTSPFAQHPVGSGPYRFVSWVPRQSIELDADTLYHLGRPHIDRLIWSIAPDPNAAFVRLLSGDADFIEYLRPQDFAVMAKHPELKVVRYPSLAYGYLLFNERDPKHLSRPHPVFGDRDVRRALTMAVDRQRLVKSVYDTLADVAIGPVTHALPGYDSTLAQIPYAPDSAKAILERTGWHASGANGMRARNGRPLRFTILVPSSSTPRVRAAVLMQQMFKDVGAQVDIEQTDFPTLVERQEAHQFDAALDVFMSDGSAVTLRQFWSIDAAHQKDGDNYGLYENPQFDALMDTAAAEMDPVRANADFRRVYALLVDDAPAIWLFEPITFAGMQRRIHPVDIRPDQWDANLDRWYIPAVEQIARDRIGFAQARR